MENFIIIGVIILVLYQIYATHKNVSKLLNEIEILKLKIDELKNPKE